MSVKSETVKELREKTGAGMMDCKKALVETKGNLEKAEEFLRKKGLSKASKKSSRITAEGRVGSYIHGEGRIGVLVEVNSETDFVSRNEVFQDFVREISMHIAALNPQFVHEKEIPESLVEKEKEILKEQALNEGKKPDFVDKVVQGRVEKWKKEICLMSQSFVKNPEVSVQDYVTEMISKIGENIVVRRFVRYELGEGLEKKKENFAEEVKAQIKN